MFCIVDLETSNGLMSAARELMMLNRLLIVCLSHAMLNIGVNLCLLVLRPEVYGAARESHNELTRNTLKHTTCSHK